MNLPTLLIIAVIAVLAGIGVRSMFKRVNQGCCTERDDDHVEMVKVSDKNKAHYPHEAVLDVDGMTCSHCAARVENALNSRDRVWAKIDLSQKTADVRMKTKLEDSTLRKAVNDLGPYTVMKISWIS